MMRGEVAKAVGYCMMFSQARKAGRRGLTETMACHELQLFNLNVTWVGSQRSDLGRIGCLGKNEGEEKEGKKRVCEADISNVLLPSAPGHVV